MDRQSLTNVRVNDFQSVNQELPHFRMHWHPFEIPTTGIIAENDFSAGYLNYVFSDDVVNGNDFQAGRVAAYPKIYRPFSLGALTATPHAGLIGIAYTNSPEGGSRGLAQGEFGVKLETALSKSTSWWKHVVEPYAHYTFLTTPSVDIDDHFIFTIKDGYNRLNVLRFGTRHAFFTKGHCGVERPIWIDVWANAFFATPTIPQTIPKGYVNIEMEPHARLFLGAEGAWNFAESQVDYYNVRLDWTLNIDVAFGLEYRHRGRFDWRKADFYNFILESTRPIDLLLASPLSDRRDTLLFRTFIRLTPDFATNIYVRHGWHRPLQPAYLEYQVEAIATLIDHWRLTFNYEKRESDNRFSFSLKLDPGPPSLRKAIVD